MILLDRLSSVALTLICAVAVHGLEAPVPRVNNGVLDSEHPAVGVVSLNGSNLCTATVVAPRKVLTAATCASTFDKEEAFFVAGDDYATPEEIIDVVGVVVDPQFDAMSLQHNFAIVELGSTVVGVTPIPLLAPQQDDLTAGTALTLVGFGETASGPNSRRRQALAEIGSIDSHLFTTEGPGQICSGDSGAPALREIDGVERIAGLGSAADSATCSLVTMSFFSRVAAAFDSFLLPTLGSGTVFADGFENGSTSAWSSTQP